ncbi:MAG TPA: DUF4124 domain-containing protein [Luteimonas sp.]|nr:DUF4124 domain-containing protein [Luteimonas sp.]HRO27244.1 DUF4124 domain-containing protein [Luteimonas sp.]HRP73135.1 DUF4124 domain-containing protein [Luteimonas sp.]
MPRLPFLALAVATVLAAPLAQGGEVYQWKDANGVTHYSQTPPPKGSYQLRQITGSGASVAPQAATTQVGAAEDSRCATARSNVATLSGNQPVQEEGEDGQPGRALNDAERAAQLELANAAVKAYCNTAAD